MTHVYMSKKDISNIQTKKYLSEITFPKAVPAKLKKFILDHPVSNGFVKRFTSFHNIKIFKLKNIDT